MLGLGQKTRTARSGVRKLSKGEGRFDAIPVVLFSIFDLDMFPCAASEDINKEAIQLQLNNGVVNQTTNNHVRIHNPQLNSKSNEQATNNPTWLLAHVWEQRD